MKIQKIIIIPAGGYDHTSKRESKNIVDFFMNLGFHTCVLNYLVLSQAIYHNEFEANSLADGLILYYPVVSSSYDISHKSSFEYLLKYKLNDELMDKFFLEKHITKRITWCIYVTLNY